MRFKTFEEFRENPYPKLGLKPKDKEEEKDKEEKEEKKPELSGTTVDSKGVIHINNWKVY